MKPIFVQLPIFIASDMKEGTILGYVNVSAISEIYPNLDHPELSQLIVYNRPVYVDMSAKNLIDRIRTASA